MPMRIELTSYDPVMGAVVIPPRLGVGSWGATDFLRPIDVTTFADGRPMFVHPEWHLGHVEPYADGWVVVEEYPIDPRLATVRRRCDLWP